MGKAKSAAARKIREKMDELNESAPEVEVGTLTFDMTTPDGDDVKMMVEYPKDRGLAALMAIANADQFGPVATKALLELKDPSVVDALAEHAKHVAAGGN